ncbi:MAG: exodeoxyribonuclease VII large subunit [Bacteroidia bacterium]
MSDSAHIYPVGELTLYLKRLLEQDNVLRYVSVSGEVSNLTYHGSGHVYFSIKDQQAQLSCAMFKRVAMGAPRIKAGDKIIATGSISVYAPRGNYQLIVSEVKQAGLGDLYQRFLALKEALHQEGLFDADHKKAMPRYPRTIGVITSPTGAAVRDVVNTIKRRFSATRIVLIPATVQGEKGAPSIIKALEQAEALGADVLLLTRGGGSLEDLWNFNEEAVARAIFACNTPVITGIGHETDLTIADFVADMYAVTPTAAAEQLVPEKAILLDGLKQAHRQINRNLEHYIDFRRQILDDYSERLKGKLSLHIRDRKHALERLNSDSKNSMLRFIEFKQQVLKDYEKRLGDHLKAKHSAVSQELALLHERLKAQSRDSILAQGYTLTLKDGKIAQKADSFNEGDVVETVFSDGRVQSIVSSEP